jgi:hypothetical protein
MTGYNRVTFGFTGINSVFRQSFAFEVNVQSFPDFNNLCHVSVFENVAQNYTFFSSARQNRQRNKEKILYSEVYISEKDR